MSEQLLPQSLSDRDHELLRRCVDLARESLEAGGEPYGSLLVDAEGTVRFEDRNRTEHGDATQHPEFAIARWAAEHLTPAERERAVTYTSGEHCAMCSAAHAWVGLGPIVFASSGAQVREWYAQWGVPAGRVSPLSIADVAPSIETVGPVAEYTEEIKRLHRRLHPGE